jgi:autotransporter adhesin
VVITANPDLTGANEHLTLRGGGNGQAVRNYFVGSADTANAADIWLGDAGYTNSTTTIYANRFAVGNSATSASGANATAIGISAIASGGNSIAFGALSSATATGAVAVGAGATVSHAGSVALGDGSTTQAAVATTGTTIADQSYTFAGTTPSSTVSVGDVGSERTITNVAAGRISATSTDAINGSQLWATNQAVDSIAANIGNINNGGGIKYFRSNSTAADSVASGAESVAVGPQATASATNAVSMGNGATASADNAIAIGAGAKATQANSLALGANSTTTANLSDAAYTPVVGVTPAGIATGEVSVGSAGAERRVTNVAAGSSPTDGVNVSQLQAVARGSIRYDTDSSGNITNRVTLSGGNPNAPVTIGNVAPGVAGTDAVNVDQLNSAVGALNGDVKKARREAWKAAAIGLAAASLRYDDRPGKVSVALGGGVWRGEGAAAYGLGYTAENGWLRVNLSGTTTGAHWGVGAGVSFTLN